MTRERLDVQSSYLTWKLVMNNRWPILLCPKRLHWPSNYHNDVTYEITYHLSFWVMHIVLHLPCSHDNTLIRGYSVWQTSHFVFDVLKNQKTVGTVWYYLHFKYSYRKINICCLLCCVYIVCCVVFILFVVLCLYCLLYCVYIACCIVFILFVGRLVVLNMSVSALNIISYVSLQLSRDQSDTVNTIPIIRVTI